MFKRIAQYLKKNKYNIIGFFLVFLSIATDVYIEDNSTSKIYARIVLLITTLYGVVGLLLTIINSKRHK